MEYSILLVLEIFIDYVEFSLWVQQCESNRHIGRMLKIHTNQIGASGGSQIKDSKIIGMECPLSLGK